MQEIIKKFNEELDDIVEWFRGEIASLRTGRATPALVEDLEVEQYEVKTPLKHVASISTPDARTIYIQPWNKSVIEGIVRAIKNSSLQLAPIVDTDAVRVTLPQLTEERRRDLVKILNTKMEDARVRSRSRRDEAWKKIQNMEKAKEIAEDEKFRAKDEIQKHMDAFNRVMDDVRTKKEKDILTV
jgi:ribosome recycling factor